MRTKWEADQQAFTNSQKLLDDTSNHYKRFRKLLPISDVTSWQMSLSAKVEEEVVIAEESL